ncbi:trimeric intracellular cation channel family protein [Melghirimyces profundicolus]|uniref:trimeric intracellular cation channel family protein n=1 Tax=Melghirimyces profundicolus TaxID=1242148 RepID=UPI000D3C1DE6|nr:trimeric intracellular cation channel family protein [Melghirimyces profundicolus]
MVWEILNLIGVVAFAVSGALVAMEEKYDLFGTLVLGFVTAFGGGVIRNILIGVPVSSLWREEMSIYLALFVILFITAVPSFRVERWKTWYPVFDAVGLAAFSIQGALSAIRMELPAIAVVTAAVLTGIGGGVIRDVLAGRKPLVFRREIYAVWAVIAGWMIGVGLVREDWQLYLLFVSVLLLRLASLILHWELPRRISKT